MNERACHQCGHVIASDANFCSACGATLAVRARRGAGPPAEAFAETSPAPHPATVEWPVLTLLPLDPLPPPAVPPPVGVEVDPLVGLIRSDPDSPSAPESDSATAFSAAKARRRAQVRRARLAARDPSPPAVPRSADVLLLDRDEVSRRHLAHLLEGFGFVVYATFRVDQAESLLATHRFAAVVLDVALDGRLDGPAALLCQHAKRSAAGVGAHPPGLIVITERARSADRVRASLVGADGVLVRPSGRGDLARMLEDIGVALPSDPRER